MAEEQWIAQMAALQQVLANVKQELGGGGGDASAAVEVFAGDLERFRDRLPAHHAEAGALSKPARVSNGGGAKPRGGSKASREAMQMVGRLKDDLEMRTQVYDDDIDFIREVKEGATDAPDMDPNYELKNLSHRFEAWKRDFKQRLHEAKHMIKKLDRHHNSQSAYSFASPETSFDVSELQDHQNNGFHGPPDSPAKPAARRSSGGYSAEPHYPAPPPEPSFSSVSKVSPGASALYQKANGYDSESSVATSVIGAQAYASEMSTPAFRVGPAPSPPGGAHHPHNPDHDGHHHHNSTEPAAAEAAKKKKHGLGKMFGLGKRVVSGR